MAAVIAPYTIHQRFVSYYLGKLRTLALGFDDKDDLSYHTGYALLEEDLAQIRQALCWLDAYALEDLELAKLVLNYREFDNWLLNLRLTNDEKLMWYKASLEAARQLHDDAAVRNNLYQVAAVYNATGRYDESIGYLQELLSLSQAAQDNRGTAKALLGLGVIDYRRANHAKAQQIFEKGVSLLKETADRSDLYGVLVMTLANTYAAQGQHELAIPLYLEGGDVHRENNDLFQLCTLLNDLGAEYSELKRYPEALAVLEEGIQIARSIDHQRTLGYLLGNTGDISFRLGRIDDAITYLKDSIAIFRNQEDIFGQLMFSAILFHLTMTAENLNESHDQLCKMIAQATKRKMKGAILSLLAAVARWYFLASDPRRSLQLLDFLAMQPNWNSDLQEYGERVRHEIAAMYPDLKSGEPLDKPLDRVVSDFLTACA